MHYDFAVIGGGPMGSSLFYHLAKTGRSVLLVRAVYGDGGAHFSAHEDSSRIVRVHHEDSFWKRHSEISRSWLQGLAKERCEPIFQECPVYYRRFADGLRLTSTSAERAKEFPVAFDSEDPAGGVMNPLAYVAEMIARSLHFGAADTARTQVITSPLKTVRNEHSGYALFLANGVEVRSTLVVDARGSFSPLLDDVPEIRRVGKILLYLRSPGTNGRKWCFLDGAPPGSVFENAYGIVGFSGKGGYTEKLGATECQGHLLPASREVKAWFAGDYRQSPHLAPMKELARHYFGRLAEFVQVKPCVIAHAPEGRPWVGEPSSRYYLVSACNGAAARCAYSLAEEIVRRWE